MLREATPVIVERSVEIAVGERSVRGTLSLPESAGGVVLFAHGSGSGRFSPRNQFVARALQKAGLATLLVDLLEEDESQNREYVFDIELLAARVEAAALWLRQNRETAQLSQGIFGASTGAAAALVAAARNPERFQALVSRGGRADLAGDELAAVTAPCLLIVGGADDVVLRLNVQALHQLRCIRSLRIIPGATHLFPEPGALEEVAKLAAEWFCEYLQPVTAGFGARSSQLGHRFPSFDMDPQC